MVFFLFNNKFSFNYTQYNDEFFKIYMNIGIKNNNRNFK